MQMFLSSLPPGWGVMTLRYANRGTSRSPISSARFLFFLSSRRTLWILLASRESNHPACCFSRERFLRLSLSLERARARARATETPKDARGIIFSSVRAERSSPSLGASRLRYDDHVLRPGMQRRRNKIGGMWSEYRDGALFCGRRKTAETIARARDASPASVQRASPNVDWRKFIEMPLEYGRIREGFCESREVC